MTHVVSPTVLDAARAVARLDENPDDREAAELVAANLGHQFARLGWGAARAVTGRDVRGALVALGASTFTVERWNQRVGTMIRKGYGGR